MTFVEIVIKNILKKGGFEYKEFEHEPVYTVEQAEKVRKGEGLGIKSLLFKTGEGKFILVVGPGRERVNEKRLARLENVKGVYLAKPEDVERIIGCKVGCVPPFGHRSRIKTYFDREVLQSEFVYFNPGSHNKTIRMKSKELLKVMGNPVMFE